MDNFMDKLAQRFSAQEMIKANSQAEAEEMKRLKLQVAEYEKILQEMRKINYKNNELSEKLDLMIGDNAEIIQSMKEDEQRLIAALRDLTDEQTRNREAELERREEERREREEERREREEERREREHADEGQKESDITAITELLENKFQQSDDFVHKENVKVYRNVQAIVVDEIKRCIRYIESAQRDIGELKKELKKEYNSKMNKVMVFSIISMVASAVSVVLWALTATGIIK